MPFACIFVPDFPVEAVLRAEPELRVRPIAILAGKPPLQKVLGVNEKARQIGIVPGMSKIQVEPCAELTLRARSPLQETAAHAALLDCAQSFSPRVEDTAPDTVILDLSGLESLFGSPARIARDLARRASDLGLEAHVASASNPDAAMLAARGFPGVTVIPEGKESDRLGNLPIDVLFSEFTSTTMPASFELPAQPKSPHIAQKTSTQKMGGTPDSVARSASATTAAVSEATRVLETLDLWGVRNLRALAALPDVALSQRLGQTGLRLQQLARGAIARTLVPVDPPLVFEEAVELDHPLILLEPLAFLLAHLLNQLCARLAARALAAQELRLRLELDTGFHFVEDIPEPEPVDEGESVHSQIPSPAPNRGRADILTAQPGAARKNDSPNHSARTPPIFTRTLQFPVPMLDPKTFLKLLQLDLNAHPPGAPILKIHLSAEPARPRRTQAGLFHPPTPEPEKLELTLARIAGMVGTHNVGSSELLDTYALEGFRIQRFVAPQINPKSSRSKKKDCKNQNGSNNSSGDPDCTSTAPITALRIFRPPLAASVTVRDGKPIHIICASRKEVAGDVLWMAGPWRSSGDWWEQDGWSRDEWDIALPLSMPGTRLSIGSGRLLFTQNSRVFSENSSSTATLALYRLVHDLLDNHWFVEGTYD
jgi:protein ImuB